jgi:hypothetical protein
MAAKKKKKIKACSIFLDVWKKKPLLVIGWRVQVMALKKSILYDMTSMKVTKNVCKSMRAFLELWPTEQAIQVFVKPCARS